MLFSVRSHEAFIAVPIVVGGLLALAYTASCDFRLRVDDTLLALITQDVSGVNFSTYALVSNRLSPNKCSKRAQSFGNGLGPILYPTSALSPIFLVSALLLSGGLQISMRLTRDP